MFWRKQCEIKMKNLINIFRAKDKPEIKTTLSADEIKPIFEANGIDIETIGFPIIGAKNKEVIQDYRIIFEEVNIKPAKIDGVISPIITGKYKTQAQVSYTDAEEGIWHPGGISYYSFKIQEGKLNIKRKN